MKNPPPSSWHSNVPGSVDVKVNDADVLEVGFDGFDVMVVSGVVAYAGWKDCEINIVPTTKTVTIN